MDVVKGDMRLVGVEEDAEDEGVRMEAADWLFFFT